MRCGIMSCVVVLYCLVLCCAVLSCPVLCCVVVWMCCRVLVCGGVLMLPPKAMSSQKRFNLPYIDGRFIVPALFILFVYFFRERMLTAFANLTHESPQEVLFIVFLLVAAIITIATIINRLSLRPILGMVCCLYLMIEIPTKSWIVFFGWMAFGLVIYFSYGFWKSKLARRLGDVSSR